MPVPKVPRFPTPVLRGWVYNAFSALPFTSPGSGIYKSNGPGYKTGSGTAFPMASHSLAEAWRFYMGVGKWRIEGAALYTNASSPDAVVATLVANSDSDISTAAPDYTVSNFTVDTGFIPCPCGYSSDADALNGQVGIIPFRKTIPVDAATTTVKVLSVQQRATATTYFDAMFYARSDSGQYQASFSLPSPWPRYYTHGTLRVQMFQVDARRGPLSPLLVDPNDSSRVFIACIVDLFGGTITSCPPSDPVTGALASGWGESGVGCTLDGKTIQLYEPAVDAPQSTAGSGNVTITTQNMAKADFRWV